MLLQGTDIVGMCACINTFLCICACINALQIIACTYAMDKANSRRLLSVCVSSWVCSLCICSLCAVNTHVSLCVCSHCVFILFYFYFYFFYSLCMLSLCIYTHIQCGKEQIHMHDGVMWVYSRINACVFTHQCVCIQTSMCVYSHSTTATILTFFFPLRLLGSGANYDLFEPDTKES